MVIIARWVVLGLGGWSVLATAIGLVAGRRLAHQGVVQARLARLCAPDVSPDWRWLVGEDPLARAAADVQFNIAVGRKDDGAKEMARDLFRLGASRLPVHGVRACATDQAA